MPVINFGDKLPSVYLDRFQPADNVPTVVSVLDMKRVVATETHWLDFPTLGIKGSYQCCGGICCKAFGSRMQNYCIPVYVYKNPQSSTEGEIQNWQLTKTLYQQLIQLANYDLTRYDLQVTVTRQGQGRRTAMTIIPPRDPSQPQFVGLRDYMTAEQKAQIQEAVEMFYSVGESSMVRQCSEADYQQMLIDLGYDFATGTFPGNPQAMSAPQARGAITSMVRPPVQQAVPGQVAAPKSFPGALPTAPQAVAPKPAIPSPVAHSAPQMTPPPVQNVPPTPVANAQTTPVNPAPVTPHPVAPHPVAPAPVTPHPVASAPAGSIPAQVAPATQVPPMPAPQVPTNTVEATQDMTAEELDAMLDEDI